MKIVICENEASQQEFLQSVISNYAMFHEPSMEVVLNTSKPEKVLECLQHNGADCYFLDIELGTSIDGMDLAREIRKQDPLANIIFITAHADKMKLTFKYKLAALDFIAKENGKERIAEQVREALRVAFNKYLQIGDHEEMNFIQIKIGERIININIADVYYFETSAQVHKIRLYERNGEYEFYGKLKDYEQLYEQLFRCHKSYLINMKQIKHIDKKRRMITMINDKECYASFRMLKVLEAKLSQMTLINQSSLNSI
ncbi:LytR/AlgR family response regulator transcription factor [Gracilibacillus lacisalsi]|uniref:LytR/AlgR family response regulator transcription factor n=1 Tax=Gracilibacillus lacisalsi TaxID=393087 RepID=UPI00037C43D3|nr:LytTR family DNA-binding domain-containing protein [Gracilibacillus lacisalsi]